MTVDFIRLKAKMESIAIDFAMDEVMIQFVDMSSPFLEFEF